MIIGSAASAIVAIKKTNNTLPHPAAGAASGRGPDSSPRDPGIPSGNPPPNDDEAVLAQRSTLPSSTKVYDYIDRLPPATARILESEIERLGKEMREYMLSRSVLLKTAKPLLQAAKLNAESDKETVDYVDELRAAYQGGYLYRNIQKVSPLLRTILENALKIYSQPVATTRSAYKDGSEPTTEYRSNLEHLKQLATSSSRF